ncbi:MAG: hypothetical protein JWP07_4418 [Pseudonocardiales bacterium]|nr:hypothetical protein [Pseudonocardiales bacterium]
MILPSRRKAFATRSRGKASVNLGQAVQSVLSQYVGFSGRARRSEYWWFFLFNLIIAIAVAIVDAAIGSTILGILVTLALLLPGIAVTIRRLHDTGRSGWWILIALVPLIGAIVLIVFACQDSQGGVNQYGPSPKYGPSPYGGAAPQWSGSV